MRIIFNYLIILLIILSIGCSKIDISNYTGDGEIFLTGGKILGKGFKIDFTTFDLHKHFERTFVMSDYPNYNGKYEVGLFIKSDNLLKREEFDGILQVEVKSGKEHLIEIEKNLNEWNYSHSKNMNHYEYWIIYFGGINHSTKEASIFYTRGKRKYDKLSIHIKYSPNNTKSIKASFQVREGGYI